MEVSARLLEKLQRDAKEAESKVLNLERQEEKVKKDLLKIQSEYKKACEKKTLEVSGDLDRIENDLKDQQRILNDKEVNFEKRSKDLEQREIRVMHLKADQKDLRDKALDAESRRHDAEILWNKAVNLEAEGKTKVEEARKLSEETKIKETVIANQIQELSLRKDEYKLEKENCEKGRADYELIKQDIDPKIEKSRELLKLLDKKELSIKQREDALVVNKNEVAKIKEYLVSQKEALETQEYELQERKIDLNNKALSMNIK